MAFRKRMKRKFSKRNFSRSSGTNRKNFSRGRTVKRGGIRL